MANYYVTKAGNDTTGDGSSGAPWLTLAKAESVVLSALGHVVNIGDGTYDEITTLVLVKAINWVGTNGASLVIVTSSGTINTAAMTGALVTTCTGITFDGEGNTGRCMDFSSSPANKTFTSCAFTGATTSLVDAPCDDLTIDQCTFSNFTGTTALNIAGSDRFVFTDNTLTDSISCRFLLNISSAGVDTTIANNTVSITATSSAWVFYLISRTGTTSVLNNNITILSGSSVLNAISLDKCTDVQLHLNTVDTSASGDISHNCIAVTASASGAYTNPHVTLNTVNSSSTSLTGILVGSDVSVAGDNSLDGAVITRNTVIMGTSGTEHGIEYGYNKNGFIEGNTVTAFHGIVIKGDDDWSYLKGCNGNLILDCGLDGILVKGARNLNVCDNTLATTDGVSPPTNGFINLTDNGTAYSTGMRAYNNIFYHENTALNINCSVNAVAGIDVNYSKVWTGGSNIGTWTIGGTTYTDYTDWLTSGHDANGDNEDPNFVDEIDYELTSSDGGGFKWWGNATRPLGQNGEPKPDTQIDRGCNQKI